MKKTNPLSHDTSNLRNRAEKKAGDVASGAGVVFSAEQITQTLHELHVHQIELEMQNEELRRVQVELETSRARYFDLYDLAPVGYCTISEKNLITEANLTLSDLLGETRSILVNQPFSRYILPGDQDIFYALSKQLQKKGTPQNCELRLQKKGGTPFWVSLTVTVHREPDGTAVSHVVISDISDSVMNKEALKKIREGLESQVLERTADLYKAMDTLAIERQRINNVLEILPAYIVLLAPDYRVKFANRLFTERFTIANNAWDFTSTKEDGAPLETRPTFKPLETRLTHQWEWNGPGNRAYEVHDFPFTDTDGTPLILEMGIDITDRKQVEAALIDANEMKLLGQLTSGVAHEVRNPLNGILAIMGALSKELPDNDQFKPYMRHMRSQVTRLTVLMEDLLSLGRPFHAESMQKIPLATMVEKSLAIWLQTMQPAKPVVRLIKPEDANACTIETDSASMTQVIINLLENAFYHSPEGSEIVVSVYDHPPANVVFSVKDRGCGIPAERLQKIFEPFFTTRKGGTGLGLSIVRRVVDNNQGDITVSNNSDGPGATFVITLPIYRRV